MLIEELAVNTLADDDAGGTDVLLHASEEKVETKNIIATDLYNFMNALSNERKRSHVDRRIACE